MTRDKWRFESPCCGRLNWLWRCSMGVYYCQHCQTHCAHLRDRKTGCLVASRTETR